jgi:hypothetical protein
MRLHNVFASQDLNADAGPGIGIGIEIGIEIEIEIEIVQFNPKLVTYDVFGPAGTTATIDYYDADANTHEVNTALPWSTTLSMTLPAVEDARRHRRVPDTNLPWVHESTSEDRTKPANRYTIAITSA